MTLKIEKKKENQTSRNTTNAVVKFKKAHFNFFLETVTNFFLFITSSINGDELIGEERMDGILMVVFK